MITWDPANPLVKFGRYPDEPAAKIDHVFLLNGASGEWEVMDARRVLTSPVSGLSITSADGASAPAPLSDHYGLFTKLVFRPIAPGLWRVYYREYLLGYLDEKRMRIMDDQGRYQRAEKKVSRMC